MINFIRPLNIKNRTIIKTNEFKPLLLILKNKDTYLKNIDSVEYDSISACQLHQNEDANKQ